MSTYVYGITAGSHPGLPEGMGGVGDPARPVRILKEGELAAIVSEAPEGLRPKRKDLLAHQNETCPGETPPAPNLGGISLWNVTDPRHPQPRRRIVMSHTDEADVGDPLSDPFQRLDQYAEAFAVQRQPVGDK